MSQSIKVKAILILSTIQKLWPSGRKNLHNYEKHLYMEASTCQMVSFLSLELCKQRKEDSHQEAARQGVGYRLLTPS